MNENVRYAAIVLAVAGGIGGAYSFPANSFIAFVIGWLFLIPAIFSIYMVKGLWVYMKEREI